MQTIFAFKEAMGMDICICMKVALLGRCQNNNLFT